MSNIFNKLIAIVCLFAVITGIQQAIGQNKNGEGQSTRTEVRQALTPTYDDGTVTTTLKPHSSDGIFSSSASYTFEVNNSYKTVQSGKVSYLITTEAGKKVKADSIHVKLGPRDTKRYDFDLPALKPGFYKVSFMINVTDYDDTTRRAFGIQPEQIHSSFGKPADFEAFWHTAMTDLSKVKPEYKITELPDSSKDGRKVYEVEMKSLGNLVVRGFLTEPVTKNKNKKFAVLLGLPGYQVTLGPMSGSDPDIAIFTINTRGQGYSRDVINVRRENYILLDLEDKNKYVLRGAVMDCVRAVDFICTRPELRHDNIIATGGSLGGFLAIATSAVDKRIAFCSAANPILSDVRSWVYEVDWPFIDIRKYINTRPGLTMEKVLNNLDYFDTKNFAPDLKCPTLVGLGELDNIIPPNNVYAMYNNIRADKHIIIFRDLAHEIGPSYSAYEGRWMRDQFALF
jgi:cephalosporin-C deacetylase